QLLQCGLAVGGIAVLWVLEPIPYHVASFVPLVVFPLSNLIPAKEVAARYMNDDVIRALSGLFISILLQTSKLNRRMALYLLLALGTSVRWLLLCYMWLVFLFSMFVTDAAVTAVMVSLVDTLVAEVYASKVRVRVARLNKAAEEARQHRDAEEARVAAEAPEAPAYGTHHTGERRRWERSQSLAVRRRSHRVPGRRFGARGSGSTKHQRAISRGPWTSAHRFCSGEDPKHTCSLERSVFRRHAAAGRQSRGSPLIRCLPLRLFDSVGRFSRRPARLGQHCAVLRKAFMLALSYSVVYGTAVLLANKTSFVLDAFLQE
ncbi:unnamed protein product, partial [Ixodes persulcatus]